MSYAEDLRDPPPHIFRAGRSTGMLPMPDTHAHAHSQIELNLMQPGEAAYLSGGRDVVVRAGGFILFWGAMPPRTVRVAARTHFVCLHLPIEMFLAVPLSASLRGTVLSGGMITVHGSLDGGWPQRLHGELLS